MAKLTKSQREALLAILTELGYALSEVNKDYGSPLCHLPVARRNLTRFIEAHS